MLGCFRRLRALCTSLPNIIDASICEQRPLRSPPLPSVSFTSTTMQTRRPPLPALPIPRRRSSLLSLNSAASPHTPRSSGCFDACPPPVCYAAHRKSTDSWNSSNADDMEFDWKPDQILLLTRVCLSSLFGGPH